MTNKSLYSKAPRAIKALLFEGRLPWRLQMWFWRHYLCTVAIDGVKLKYRAQTSDMYVIEDIFKRDEYHSYELDVSEEAIIFDVGAHIGAFTVKMAQLAKRGRIFSFEPMPANFRILKKNVALNKFQHVSIFPTAMSGSETPTSFRQRLEQMSVNPITVFVNSDQRAYASKVHEKSVIIGRPSV